MKKKYSPLIIAIISLLLHVPSVMAQGSFVFNGHFDTDASGWTMTDVYTTSVGGFQSNIGNPDGCFSLYNPSASKVPTLSQTLSLASGTTYLVTGDYMAGVGKDYVDSSLRASIDGVTFYETTAPQDKNWHSFSFLYTANSSSSLFSISAQLNNSGFSYFIDNLSVQAVPEPCALTLFGFGTVAGFVLLRRKAARAHC